MGMELTLNKSQHRESQLWTENSSAAPAKDLNLQPFDGKSGTPTTELSWPFKQ